MLKVVLLSLILCAVAKSELWSGLDVPRFILSTNINRPKEIEKYVACAVDQGPCDNSGTDLKPIMVDLVTTQRCSLCRTNREKSNFRYLLRTMPINFPNCWNVMVAKFKRNRNLMARGCSN